MAKVQIPVGLVIKIVPALMKTVEEVVKATRRTSPGGKKITKAELKTIVDAAVERLKPVLADELSKALDVE